MKGKLRHRAGTLLELVGGIPLGDPQSPTLGCNCLASVGTDLPGCSGSGVGAEGPFYHHLRCPTCTDTQLARRRWRVGMALTRPLPGAESLKAPRSVLTGSKWIDRSALRTPLPCPSPLLSPGLARSSL
uniref:Uncharacterized protein n=1 Tax=Anser brachyrhynchus TaxID=132585 RepID=A0A8B9CGE4_9AVES